MNHPRIFISTGEVSGDLLGSLLIKSLIKLSHHPLEIIALGGSKMAEAGATLLADTSGIGSIGILESLPFVLPTLKIQAIVKKYLTENPPDLVVLIDYMGSNLNLGAYLRQTYPNLPIIYYIAPQMWVWHPFPAQVKSLVKMVDLILAIFPQEAKFFTNMGAKVQWVGHPLIDRIASAPTRQIARTNLGIPDDQIAVSLLLASRPQELHYLLPVICQGAQILQAQFPNLHYWIPLSLEKYRHKIEQAIARYNLKATIVTNQTLEVLASADLAIGKSGTVNLELALLNIPQVVIYRINPITHWIGRHLFKLSIPFMSPANLIQMKPIVPELFQDQATPANIVHHSLALLNNLEARHKIIEEYQVMRQAIGELGVSDRAATAILKLIPI